MSLPKQNWFVPLLSFLLTGALLVVFTQFVTQSTIATPGRKDTALVAEPRSYDFGTISMASGKVRQTFTVTNPTTETIRLTGAETSCMCTEMMLMDSTGQHMGNFGMASHGQSNPSLNYDLPAGGSVTVEAVFDPAAHGPAGVGPITRQLILRSSVGTLSIPIKAMVTP